MSDHAIDDYLLNLIRGEVERAAKSDAEFATVKARRDYGVCLIRNLPNDLNWSAMEASIASSGTPPVSRSSLEPEAIVKRLEKRWRKEASPIQKQAGPTAKGISR